jgi:hypothetical protein
MEHRAGPHLINGTWVRLFSGEGPGGRRARGPGSSRQPRLACPSHGFRLSRGSGRRQPRRCDVAVARTTAMWHCRGKAARSGRPRTPRGNQSPQARSHSPHSSRTHGTSSRPPPDQWNIEPVQTRPGRGRPGRMRSTGPVVPPYKGVRTNTASCRYALRWACTVYLIGLACLSLSGRSVPIRTRDGILGPPDLQVDI